MKLINFELLSYTELALFASLVVVFLVQLYYLLRYYLKLAFYRNDQVDPERKPISVILPVRNEEERIREIVARFAGQSFENYQLIVINQFSEDNTLTVLNTMAEVDSRLKITSLSQETRFNDKQSINIGLKGAEFPWVVLVSSASGNIHPEWLERFSGLLRGDVAAVVAYSNVARSKGFRNLVCRLERFHQFMISGSWILAGKPFVFSETNIVFQRSVYFDGLGFRNKLNRNFANLELIFNESFRKGQVKLSVFPETVVRENIEDDRGDHVKLLKKSVQIRQSLSFGKKFSLFADDLSRILLLGLATALPIIYSDYWLTLLAVPFLYLVTLAIIVNLIRRRLNEQKIFLSSFVYILIKPLINWWVYWFMYVIQRRNKWN